MLVVDASLVVAALIDSGKDGTWAHELLGTDQLAAPHLMPVEATTILRRAVRQGDLSADSAALAHADLLALRIDLFPYGPFSARVWELRGNVTCYDAWYVALAETLETRLATLDVRLSRSQGPRCLFETPRDAS
jgi:predicted nucleic acid-binding protein